MLVLINLIANAVSTAGAATVDVGVDSARPVP